MPISNETGVFKVNDLESLRTFFEENGFAILRDLYAPTTLEDIREECLLAQNAVINGAVSHRHGNVILLDDGVSESKHFTNYVQYITEIAPVTRQSVLHSTIIELMHKWVPGGHLRENSRFGVVYQDARGGRNSGYRRIGWHSDWQAYPHKDVWPSVAFTINLDATSPENGFLRVVPGSHKWATPAPFINANNVPLPENSQPFGGRTDETPPYKMPLAFEKAKGEIGVYCEEGDILFHDAYLWHSAAAPTNERAIRRHVRGGWFSGSPDEEHKDYVEDFVKNAAR